MVSLNEYIHHFNNKPITFTEFMKVATVKVGNTMYSLKDYAKKKNIDLENLRMIFENIQSRNEYLERFYITSLAIPDNIHITEPPMKLTAMNNNAEINYKNIVRNTFWLEILKNTKSGMKNNPTFMDVLEDLYKRYIIDYKLLTPSALHYIKDGRIGSVFSSYFFRASIMNPYLVYSLNKSVLHGSKIFTPTLGWSSYFYGFAESGSVTEYVGVDVIPSVCKKTAQFANKNYPHIRTNWFCRPSESLAVDPAFLRTYKNHFDLVFFSPPYFKLELYEGKMQSTSQYPTYEDWLNQYWIPTVKLCYHVLQKGGRFCYILSGYGNETTEQYDLLKDMNTISKTYFRLKRTVPMYNKNVHVTTHRETAEKIMLFVKE